MPAPSPNRRRAQCSLVSPLQPRHRLRIHTTNRPPSTKPTIPIAALPPPSSITTPPMANGARLSQTSPSPTTATLGHSCSSTGHLGRSMPVAPPHCSHASVMPPPTLPARHRTSTARVKALNGRVAQASLVLTAPPGTVDCYHTRLGLWEPDRMPTGHLGRPRRPA